MSERSSSTPQASSAPEAKTTDPPSSVVGDSTGPWLASTANPPPAVDESPISVELPPKLLDRYEFRRHLGRGGFGNVFEAWDERLHRLVAIKIARNDRFDAADSRQRFLDESRAAARLSHPHIVTVFDSGQDADGNAYVVFELIVGESLAEQLKRGPLERDQVVRVVIEIAEAVHAAHKLGLVHRDLKPANILIDRHGHAYVTDFGLAVDERTQWDQAGNIAGSPQYMSPEQIRGETQFLDGRTDIWSLGVLFYEALGGRRPFLGRTVVELREEILSREPKPLRQIDESISPALESICLKCLRKSVLERWTTAADVAAALRATLVEPRPKSVSFRLLQWGWVAAIPMIFAVAFFWLNRGAEPRPAGVAPAGDADRQIRVEQHAPATPVFSTDTASAVSGPIPGKWFPLLSRPPEYLQWPVDERNSRREYHDVNRELWLICEDVGFVKLGTAGADFELRMQLHQSPWTGNFGVFFGLQESNSDGATARRFQMIELACPRDRRGEYAFLNRVYVVAERGLPNRTTLSSRQLPPLINDDGTLKITAKSGRLSSISWNGIELTELVGEAIDRNLAADANAGMIGIRLDHCSVVIRNAELFVPRELTK